MRGQKSVPPKKKLSSLRVGSLHANKQGRLFKVVKLASNKKAWRVSRAKPKPQPKKTKRKAGPKRRALTGGSKRLDQAKARHEEKHNNIKLYFCDLLANQSEYQTELLDKFEELYGQVFCNEDLQQVDEKRLAEFLVYVSNNANLGDNMGCEQCLTFLKSKELQNYVAATPEFVQNKKQSILNVLRDAIMKVRSLNPYDIYEEMELGTIQKLHTGV